MSKPTKRDLEHLLWVIKIICKGKHGQGYKEIVNLIRKYSKTI